MITLTPDSQERKRIMSDVYRRHNQWYARIAMSYVLFTGSIGIIITMAFLLILHPTSPFGIFVFLTVGLCLACIPFAVALSVKTTAKYKCGLPYSSYANGTAILDDEEFEYIFWRVGPHEPAAYSSKRAIYRDEDKFIYKINRNEITSIVIKNDICYVKGSGIVLMPNWAEEDQIVRRSFNEFSFLLAFEQKGSEQIINEWRN